ncbi:MAG: radical SAM protein [Candidatus Diapherotrites archaeon]|nr:radical SAM protein [Candidatus Diapherotrites archaeon]
MKFTQMYNRLNIWNSFKNKNAYVSGYPIDVKIETTNICNLNCVMCPNSVMKRKKGFIDLNLVKKIVSEVKPYAENISLHFMGEPLLHPNLFEIIKECKKANINTIFSTNARLMTKKLSKGILSSGLDLIIMNLDGTNKETYETIRRNSDFEKTKANIMNLLKTKIKYKKKTPLTVVQAVQLKKNEKEMNSFKNMWEKIGVDGLKVRIAHTWSGSVDIETKKETRPKVANLPCFDIWAKIVITWNGNVVPCCNDFDAQNVFGNINKQTISEVWNCDKFVDFRKKLLTKGHYNIPICKDCYPKEIKNSFPSFLLRSQYYRVKSFFCIKKKTQ